MTAKAERPKMSTSQIRDALRERYAPPAWALFEEVGNATGMGSSRWADAVAMGLWHSRGIDIHGFEIKCNRNDVIRELRDPSKAEAVAEHCDFWWLAVGDASIVKDGELPENWGLLVPAAKGLITAKKPKRLRTTDVIKRTFVASILRRAHEQWSSHALRRSIHGEIYLSAKQEAEDAVRREHEYEQKNLRAALDGANRSVERLQSQLDALKSTVYSAHQIERAVKLLVILDGWQGPKRSVEHLLRHAENAQELASRIHASMSEVDELLKELVP